MSKKRKIVADNDDVDLLTVVGSVNADIYIEVERMPYKGETISSTTNDCGYMLPGGKGANQAVVCSNLYGRSRFIGMFGTDTHASTLKKVLTEHNVDISLCNEVNKASGQAYIFLHNDGDNSIIIVGAANAAWNNILSNDIKHAIEKASIVLLQREIPYEINLQAAKIAKAANVRVIMDVGGRDDMLNNDILPYIYILSPNEGELARITGLPTTTRQNVIDASKQLIKHGVEHVLVKLGARGSLLISHIANNDDDDDVDIYEQKIMNPVNKIVDTTGAGDAFTGAFAVALAEGKTIKDSMKFATATATLAIQKIGAMPSMPTRQQVDDFLNTQ